MKKEHDYEKNALWIDAIKIRVAESINDYLARTGKTQQELADKLGIHRSGVTKYLKKAYLPNLDSLKQLSDVIGVSPNYFFTGANFEKDTYKNFITLMDGLTIKEQKIVLETAEFTAKMLCRLQHENGDC